MRRSPREGGLFCCGCGERTEVRPCSHCGEEPALDGRYVLEEVLGRGAGATTWRASADGRTLAIKETPLHAHDAPKVAELAQREAAVLRQLDDPRIPAFVDCIVAGRGKARSLYLVQEYVAG